MASGALPPALPMIKIGTDHFWDGGIVSNTPLQHLLDQDDKLNTLVFQVDLFSARGVLPRDIQDVMARHKDSDPFQLEITDRLRTMRSRWSLCSCCSLSSSAIVHPFARCVGLAASSIFAGLAGRC
jgi:hypothetical protein